MTTLVTGLIVGACARPGDERPPGPVEPHRSPARSGAPAPPAPTERTAEESSRGGARGPARPQPSPGPSAGLRATERPVRPVRTVPPHGGSPTDTVEDPLGQDRNVQSPPHDALDPWWPGGDQISQRPGEATPSSSPLPARRTAPGPIASATPAAPVRGTGASARPAPSPGPARTAPPVGGAQAR